MKDWKAIAVASGLDLPAGQVDRIVPPLESLEATFRPLIAGLTPDLEPSFHFALEGEESE